MRKASSILICLMYAISIFGYSALDFFHYAAHKIKNPVHHDHGVHHHHEFQDHHASKLLNPQNAEQHKAQSIDKTLYFFSFLEPIIAVKPQHELIKQSVFGCKQNVIIENSLRPPLPPPELARC